MPNRKLNIFLCHAKEDKSTVRELYRKLAAEGWMDIWLDEENLFPGQEWDMEIEKAVEQSDIVVVCLSARSLNKEGYVQKELRFVLNIADEKPEETLFVIPLRLDECVVPRRLRAEQYANYFPEEERARAYERLLVSLRMRAKRLEIPTADSADKQARKDQEEQERKVAEERALLLAAQKAETERIAREKAEAERVTKAEHDRLARQKADERRKATADAFRKINFKQILSIGGIALALVILFFVGKFIFENLPSIPTPTQTSEIFKTSEVSTASPTFTSIPPTEPSTEIPIIIPTPEPGVGSSWISPNDGMTMFFVPAGEFTMGSDNGNSNEKPVHTVYLDSYWIDQTEVTNAMYAKCVQAGDCTSPSSTSSYTRQSYYGNSEFDDFPVIYVSWNDANAYCEWRGDGTRLPTEAEWEKAASWDDQTNTKRVYPRGDSIDCSLANYSSCKGDTTKVGSYPSGASFYGALDMAGNVWEWVSDWYQAYPGNTVANDSYGTTYRVLRGGARYFIGGSVRSAGRDWSGPAGTYYFVGFRCSRSP